MHTLKFIKTSHSILCVCIVRPDPIYLPMCIVRPDPIYLPIYSGTMTLAGFCHP